MLRICFCLPRIYQVYLLRTLISLLYYGKGVRPLRMGCIGDSPHALALAQVPRSVLAHWKTQKPQASIRVGRHYVPTAINPGTRAHHLLGHCCSRCGPPTQPPPGNKPFTQHPSPVPLLGLLPSLLKESLLWKARK